MQNNVIWIRTPLTDEDMYLSGGGVVETEDSVIK